MSPFRRYIFSIIALLFVGFSLSGITSYFLAHNSQGPEDSRARLPETLSLASALVETELATTIATARLLAADPFFPEWIETNEEEKQKIYDFLKQWALQTDVFTAFFVSDTTGEYYHPSGVPSRLNPQNPQSQWYFHARRMKENFEVVVSIDTLSSNKPVIFVNYKVFSADGLFLGVAGIGVELSEVSRSLSLATQFPGQTLHVIDTRGTIVASTNSNFLTYNLRDLPAFAKFETGILNDAIFSQTVEATGTSRLILSKKTPTLHWSILTEHRTNILNDSNTYNVFGIVLVSGITAVLIGGLILFLATSLQDKLRRMATTDIITQTLNRHAFSMAFKQQYASVRRRRVPLAGLLVDIDDFKTMNTEYGRKIGDTILKTLAVAIGQSIRKADIICRWGSGEFIIILPDCDHQGAGIVKEKVLESIAQSRVDVSEKIIRIPVTIGQTSLLAMDTEDQFIDRLHQSVSDERRKAGDTFNESV